MGMFFVVDDILRIFVFSFQDLFSRTREESAGFNDVVQSDVGR